MARPAAETETLWRDQEEKWEEGGVWTFLLPPTVGIQISELTWSLIGLITSTVETSECSQSKRLQPAPWRTSEGKPWAQIRAALMEQTRKTATSGRSEWWTCANELIKSLCISLIRTVIAVCTGEMSQTMCFCASTLFTTKPVVHTNTFLFLLSGCWIMETAPRPPIASASSKASVSRDMLESSNIYIPRFILLEAIAELSFPVLSLTLRPSIHLCLSAPTETETWYFGQISLDLCQLEERIVRAIPNLRNKHKGYSGPNVQQHFSSLFS